MLRRLKELRVVAKSFETLYYREMFYVILVNDGICKQNCSAVKFQTSNFNFPPATTATKPC